MWFHADKTKANFKKFQSELPPVLANQAVHFFVGSFKEQGFDNDRVDPWEEVKRRQEGTPEYKYPKNRGLNRRTKSILVMTDRLRSDVNNSADLVTFKLIRLRVRNPYARYLNNGTDNMVARPFMRDSVHLRKLQHDKIKQMMRKNFV